MAEREYRRLTRAHNRSFFSVVGARSSLWLGKDHLLQIDTSGYTESYKRFHFRDIQAIVFCRTRTWLHLAYLFGAVAGFFGLIAALSANLVATWVFGCISAIPALCLLYDLIAGPTVKCCLRTAVQTEMLVSISRLRRAHRAMRILRPLITQAQGQTTPGPAAPPPDGQTLPPIISEVPPPVVEPAGPAPVPSGGEPT